MQIIKCESCGYTGRALDAHYGYKWWYLFAIPLICTGVGVIPMVFAFIWLGNRTFDSCPNCKEENPSRWYGNLSPESERIWANAVEDDERAFRNNKLILLGFVVAILLAVVLWITG